MKVTELVMQHAKDMVEAHYPSHREYMVAEALLSLAAAPEPADTQAPFDNCKYQVCDLPGQCKAEGKCHHPKPAAPTPETDALISQMSKEELVPTPLTAYTRAIRHARDLERRLQASEAARERADKDAENMLNAYVKENQQLFDRAEKAEQELAQIREALAGQDYGSLPSDFPTVRMAHSIKADRDKFLDQVRNTCVRAEGYAGRAGL